MTTTDTTALAWVTADAGAARGWCGREVQRRREVARAAPELAHVGSAFVLGVCDYLDRHLGGVGETLFAHYRIVFFMSGRESTPQPGVCGRCDDEMYPCDVVASALADLAGLAVALGWKP